MKILLFYLLIGWLAFSTLARFTLNIAIIIKVYKIVPSPASNDARMEAAEMLLSSIPPWIEMITYPGKQIFNLMGYILLPILIYIYC